MAKEISLDDLATMIKGEFDRVHEEFDKRFGKVDVRFERVETRLDGVETRLEHLETKVDSLDQKVTRIDERTQHQIDANYERTYELTNRVVRIEKHLGLKPSAGARV